HLIKEGLHTVCSPSVLFSKHSSIGTRCSDGRLALRAELPPLALPPDLELPRRPVLPQRRRSTRLRSSRCDGSHHMGRGESQVHTHKKRKSLGWFVPVRAAREAGMGGKRRKKGQRQSQLPEKGFLSFIPPQSL